MQDAYEVPAEVGEKLKAFLSSATGTVFCNRTIEFCISMGFCNVYGAAGKMTCMERAVHWDQCITRRRCIGLKRFITTASTVRLVFTASVYTYVMAQQALLPNIRMYPVFRVLIAQVAQLAHTPPDSIAHLVSK